MMTDHGRSAATPALTSAAGSPQPSSDGGRRSPSRRAWLRSLIGLPGLLALLVGLAASAAAQTETTLVRNTGQALGASSNHGTDRAQPFTTGSHAAGYTLTSVTFPAAGNLDSDHTQVYIRQSGPSSRPSDSLGTLTLTQSSESEEVTGTSEGIDLAASTTYFVTIESTDPIGTNTYQRTNSDNEDAGTAAGWSIGDTSFFHSAHNELPNWAIAATSQTSWMISIQGTTKTDSYTIALKTQPTHNVTVTVTAAAGVQVNKSGGAAGSSQTLTFTPSTTATLWSTPQTITVTGVDDDIDNADDARTVAIGHAAASTDASYTIANAGEVSVTVEDDDTAGVTVAETGGGTAVSEDGTTKTDTYTVVLDTEPTHTVTVNITADAGATASPASLTFEPSGATDLWSAPQTVTVTGVDDDIDNTGDSRSKSVSHVATSSDPKYSAVGGNVDPVAVTVEDDDTRGLVFSSPSVTVSEGGTATYTVRLASQPTLAFNPPSGGSTTAMLWSDPQAVTVAAAEDDGSADESVTLAHSASGGDYGANSVGKGLRVTAADNEPKGSPTVTIAGGAAIDEGDNARFPLTLDTSEFSLGGPVHIQVGVRVPWSSGRFVQTVLVTGGNRHFADGFQTTDNIARDYHYCAWVIRGSGYTVDGTAGMAPAAGYDGTDPDECPSGATILVRDTDAPAPVPEITIAAKSGAAVTEGGDAEFTVSADPAPGAALAVGLDVAADDASDFVAPGSEGARTVVIPAGAASATYRVATSDDSADEPDGEVTVTVAASTADPANYTVGTASAASVAVNDNDATTVTLAGSTSAVTEGGSKTFTLSLNRGLRGGEKLAVPLAFSGTAIRGASADYTLACPSPLPAGVGCAGMNSGAATVTFTGPESGASAGSVAITLTARSDGAAEPGGETVNVGLGALTATALDSTAKTDSFGPFTINDAPITTTSTVNFTGLPYSGNEGDAISITVTISPTRSSATTVGINYTDVDTSSGDYSKSPTSVTIPAKTASRTFEIQTTEDQAVEEDESFIINIGSLPSGVQKGAASEAIVYIDDDDGGGTADTTAPRVSSVVRHSPPSSPTSADSLTWRVAFSEAVRNVDAADFAISNTTAALAAAAAAVGNAGTTYDVTASGGNLAGLDATVTLSFANGQDIKDASGNALTNTAPTGTNDNSYVVNNTAPPPPPPPSTPVVRISGGNAITEGGKAAFTLSASPAPAGTISVNVNVGQQGNFAAAGETGLRQVDIAASGTASFDVDTVNDSTDESDGRITAAVRGGTGYNPHGTNASGSVTVRDNDDPPPPPPPPPEDPEVSFSQASAEVGEDAGTVHVGLELDPAPLLPLTVRYTIAGTADEDDDFIIANAGSIRVDANATRASIPVAIIDDSAEEDAETIVLTLSSGFGYDRGGPRAHTLTINASDAPPLPPVLPSIAITGGEPVDEGGAAVFALTADPAPRTEITVGVEVADSGDFAAGGQTGTREITIGTDGTGSLTVATVDDETDEPDGVITATLGAGDGYETDADASEAAIAIADNDETPNTPPTGADLLLTLDEDGVHVFRASDFGFSDEDEGDALTAIRLATVPDAGELGLNGEPATAGQNISRAAIDAGALVFAPAANAHGSPYAGFGFYVSDGKTESANRNAVTVDVRPINDPATGLPEITGDPVPGGALFASVAAIMDVDGIENAEFGYQWLRVIDGAATPVENANGSGFRVGEADVGAMLRVRVDFTDDDGFAESITSAGTRTARPGRPSAPTGFAAAAGDGGATLTWQAPEFNGGAPVTAYEYRFAQGETIPEGTGWTATGTGLTATVAGLENGNAHTFELRAVNRAGPGAAATARIDLPIPESPPGAPTDFTATGGEREVLLNWAAPADDGNAPVTGYQYRFAAGDVVPPAAPWRSAGTDRRELVAGLDFGQRYRFELRAVNRVGPGPAVAASAETAPRGFSNETVEGWLARFGRTAAGDTAEAIRQRLEEGPQRDQLILGGRDVAGFFDQPQKPETEPDEPLALIRLPDAGETLFDRMGTAIDDGRFSSTAPLTAAGPAGNAAAGIGAGRQSGPGMANAPGTNAAPGGFGVAAGQPRPGAHPGGRGLPRLGDLLLNSSFFHTFQEEDENAASGNSGNSGNGWGTRTIWGNAARGRFDAGTGGFSLDAEVDTGTAGFDAQRGQWLAGAALSHSVGDGRFGDADGAAGTAESSLTGIYPYAHYQFDPRTSFWGTAGFASGDLRLMPDRNAPATETDIGNLMAAIGGRSVLSTRTIQNSRFELAVRSDALLTRTSADGNAMIAAADASTRRLRLLLEATGSIATGNGMLSPTLEAGFRHDGGDAETGAGFELGGGLAWRAGPLTLQLNGRGLLTHADDDFEEWGYSAGVQYEPGADGRGLRMNLSSVRGEHFGGAEQLWDLRDAGGLNRNRGPMRGRRTELELGYGLRSDWRESIWYPYFGVENYAAGGRALKFGLKLNAGKRIDAGFEYGRRESGFESPLNAIQLRGQIRF